MVGTVGYKMLRKKYIFKSNLIGFAFFAISINERQLLRFVYEIKKSKSGQQNLAETLQNLQKR
jgi:hypothetical protein